MTRDRRYSPDLNFSAWLRQNPELDSQTRFIYVTDVDFAVFQFQRGVIYFLEVKTRGGSVGRHQEEVLSILDQGCQKLDGAKFKTLRGYRPLQWDGAYRLVLQDTDPTTSQWMRFGRIGQELHPITTKDLERILGGTSDPIAPANWLAMLKRDDSRERETWQERG